MIYPLPRDISFEDWTAQLQNYSTGLTIINPYPEDKWWNWVDALKQMNPRSNIPVASKGMYPNVTDWRKWGQFFLNNLNTN